jgi:hypothetical protein
MIEMLIALTISSMLLSACLVALDGSFKSYERTTEAASTHVVSRLVMHRILGMIRQGEEFGPYPLDVLSTPRIQSNYIEFVSDQDPDVSGNRTVTRLERVDDPLKANTYRLQYTKTTFVNGTQTSQDQGYLIRNLRDATFTMEYDVGPRLLQATVDLTILPDDTTTNGAAIQVAVEGDILRLIASASPRRLDQ